MATYVITEACIGVKDATCVEVCPVACIHTTPDAPQYYIDPDICIACEQCLFVCPVNAIYLDADVPPNLQQYLEVNAEFFREHKSAAAPVSLTQAARILAMIQAYARDAGLTVAVAVVDPQGAAVATASMDTAGAEDGRRALDRAYTAASLQVATHQLTRGAERPEFTMPETFDQSRMAAEGGGYPLVDGSDVIGAIGVAGSGSPQQDLQYCLAGLEAIKAPAA